MEEIIEKTKLDVETINQTIDKRKNYNLKKMTESKNTISLESEIAEMKNDIKELKNTIKELVERINAVYDFVENV